MPPELSEKKNVEITSIRSNDKTQTRFFRMRQYTGKIASAMLHALSTHLHSHTSPI